MLDLSTSLADVAALSNQSASRPSFHHVDFLSLEPLKLNSKQLRKKKLIAVKVNELKPTKFHPIMTSFVLDYTLQKGYCTSIPSDNEILKVVTEMRPPVTRYYNHLSIFVLESLNLTLPSVSDERVKEIYEALEAGKALAPNEDDAVDAEIIYRISNSLATMCSATVKRRIMALLQPPTDRVVPKPVKEEEKPKITKPRRAPPITVNTTTRPRFCQLPSYDPKGLIQKVCADIDGYLKGTPQNVSISKQLFKILRTSLQSKAMCYNNTDMEYLADFFRSVFLRFSVNPQLLQLNPVLTASGRKKAPPRGKRTSKVTPTPWNLQLLYHVCAILTVIPDFNFDENIIGEYSDGIDEAKKQKGIVVPKPDDPSFDAFVRQRESGFGMAFLMSSVSSVNSFKGYAPTANLCRRFLSSVDAVRVLVKKSLLKTVVAPSITSAMHWRLSRLPVKEGETRSALTQFIQSILEENLGVTALKGILRLIPMLAIPNKVSAAQLLESVWKRPKLNRDARALIVQVCFGVFESIPLLNRSSSENKDLKSLRNVFTHASTLADQDVIATALLENLTEARPGYEALYAEYIVGMLDKMPITLLRPAEEVFFKLKNPKIDTLLRPHNCSLLKSLDFNHPPDITKVIISLLRSYQGQVTASDCSFFNDCVCSLIKQVHDSVETNVNSDSEDPFEYLLDVVGGMMEASQFAHPFIESLKSSVEALVGKQKFIYFINISAFVYLVDSVQFLPIKSPLDGFKWLSLAGRASLTTEDAGLIYGNFLTHEERLELPLQHFYDVMNGKSREFSSFRPSLVSSTFPWMLFECAKPFTRPQLISLLRAPDLDISLRTWLTQKLVACKTEGSVISGSQLTF
ncbi:hypothetical protein GEMRC1_002924 [Eukaryota sp. GEM-RC1]